MKRKTSQEKRESIKKVTFIGIPGDNSGTCLRGCSCVNAWLRINIFRSSHQEFDKFNEMKEKKYIFHVHILFN